jgi:hypothetical protein
VPLISAAAKASVNATAIRIEQLVLLLITVFLVVVVETSVAPES